MIRFTIVWLSVVACAPAKHASTTVRAGDPIDYTFADPARRTMLATAFPKIDAAIADEMALEKIPGVAIGVVIDGELAYAKGYGTNRIDAIYRIGSVTKSFTALAILALRDDGALAIDDPLARWIPEAAGLAYPSRDAAPITLHQLLTHNSGLPRVGSFQRDIAPSEQTIVDSLAGFPLENPPGAKHVYSNLGFSLLGIVASRAGKKSFHDLVADRIWKPLGMTSTTWSRQDVPGKTRLGAGDGSGGIYSTIADMAKYVAFQLAAYPPRDDDDRGPIRRATVRESHGAGPRAPSWTWLDPAPKPGKHIFELGFATYAYGWTLTRSCDYDDLVNHDGLIDTYQTQIYMLPTRGVGIIVASDSADAVVETLADRVLTELRATTALAPRIVKASPALATAMQRLLAIQNTWDAAAYAAMLDPVRGADERERGELAGYRALHGACTTFEQIEGSSPRDATFRVACERGRFEMGISISPATKLLTGFHGISRDVAPDDVVRAASELAKTLDGNPDLQWAHGTCTVREIVHDTDAWRATLACERGGGLVLAIATKAFDALPDRCPTR